MLARITIWMVRLYKRWLAPLLPPACIYEPTCSQYMIGAVERHGFIRGVAMGLWRIVRCNPFAKGGYDPVPGTGDTNREHETPCGHARGEQQPKEVNCASALEKKEPL